MKKKKKKKAFRRLWDVSFTGEIQFFPGSEFYEEFVFTASNEAEHVIMYEKYT